MNAPINLENCEAVVMYNSDGIAFKWTPVEKRTKTHIVALGVNFSLKTGKVAKNQNQNSRVLWTPPQFLTRRQPVTIPYQDVAVKVEPFDMNNLETIEKQNGTFDFVLDIFRQNPTVENFMEQMKEQMEEQNIPMNATVENISEFGISLSYKRKETLEERTQRLYYEPTLQDMKSRKELERCQAELEAKQRELEEIREKVQLAKQIR